MRSQSTGHTSLRAHKLGVATPSFWLERKIVQLAAASLSCVLVSKSLASWRSCNWLDGSPDIRLTIRPRFTAGRSKIASAQRWTFL